MTDSYRHLRYDEREALAKMRDAAVPVCEIAARLGRHRSTIYRELRRYFMHDEEAWFRGYFPVVAHKRARRRRAAGRKLERNMELAADVVQGLRRRWSPEQIAGRMRLTAQQPRVSHETIYQYVYGTEGRRLGLSRLLPWARRRRRPRGGRKPRGVQIPLLNGIKHRPPEIALRAAFGHWEGDLVAFRQIYGKANLTSLVERTSRFAVLWRNPDRGSVAIMGGICAQLGPLPSTLRQTITFDRGTEFAAYRRLRTELGIESYFCDPKAPWQKGGVENFNGRLRRYLPSDTDIAAMDEMVIQAVCHQLNNTPRKCLSYRTPQEVLTEQIGLWAPGSDVPWVGLAPPKEQ